MLVSLREPVDLDNMLLLTGLVGWRVDINDLFVYEQRKSIPI